MDKCRNTNKLCSINSRKYIKAIILATIDISRKYYGFQDELIALRHTDKDIKLQNEISHSILFQRSRKCL
ncbi:hypothetical protein [Clostridium pasteurianum]|uniref:hypothetical protein n=1 Tax=Clostridium pasteurianum TaxID=1501 RepID=UPI0003A5C425|nr:hypothetical protein [Clostridium pasteurianum]